MTVIFGVGKHPGVVEEQRSLGPFRVTRTRYARLQKIPPHEHALSQVYFVVSGGFCDFGPWNKICRAGTSVYLPAGVEHAQEMLPDGARCLNVEIDCRWLGDLIGGDVRSGFGRARVVSAHDALAARRLEHALAQDDAHARLHAAAVVLDRLAFAISTGTSGIADKAAGWLREHWSDARINDLSREMGVHPGHLSRAFRARFGVTPRTYLAGLRVDRACELLRAGVRPRDAARACGYAQGGHLTRAIRRRLGTTIRSLAQDPAARA